MAWLPMMAFGFALAGALVALVMDAWSGGRQAAAAAALGLGCAAVASIAAALDGAGVTFALINTGAGYSALQAGCFALAAAALVAGAGDLQGRPHGGQVAALVAFAASASAALVGVRELVGLLVLLESIALLGYALVASARTRASDEAALKYFVQGSIAAGLLVYGVGIMAGLKGGILVPSATATAALSASVLIACALAFKLGAFPFHSWVPDAYESAPAPVAAFLAAAPKLAAMVAVASLFDGQGIQSTFPQVATVFALLAAASILFGNLAALRQRSLARMLGYSAVANAGYALVAMVSPQPRFAVSLFAVTYALAAVGAFASVQAIRDLRPDWDGSIAGMAGIARRSPALGLALCALMLSLTGIPLTAGFWGKVPVFLYAIQSSWGFTVAGLRIDGLTLALIGMAGSVISFGYYGTVLRAAFLDPEIDSVDGGGEQRSGADSRRTGRGAAGVAVVAAVLVIVLGVAPFATGLVPIARALALP